MVGYAAHVKEERRGVVLVVGHGMRVINRQTIVFCVSLRSQSVSSSCGSRMLKRDHTSHHTTHHTSRIAVRQRLVRPSLCVFVPILVILVAERSSHEGPGVAHFKCLAVVSSIMPHSQGLRATVLKTASGTRGGNTINENVEVRLCLAV